MSAPKRVGVERVHSKLQSGQALLVCAYESDTKFRQAALDGAIPFSEFESRCQSAKLLHRGWEATCNEHSLTRYVEKTGLLRDAKQISIPEKKD